MKKTQPRKRRDTVSVRLDPDVKEALDALARADDRTLSSYVNRVLRTHVEAARPSVRKG